MPKDIRQLYNHLSYVRRRDLDGVEHMSYDQLAKWCLEHRVLPENVNEAFVACYQINIDGDDPESFPRTMKISNPKGYYKLLILIA